MCASAICRACRAISCSGSSSADSSCRVIWVEACNQSCRLWAFEQPRILDRHPRGCRQRRHDLPIVGAELTGCGPGQVEVAEHLVPDPDRHPQEAGHRRMLVGNPTERGSSVIMPSRIGRGRRCGRAQREARSADVIEVQCQRAPSAGATNPDGSPRDAQARWSCCAATTLQDQEALTPSSWRREYRDPPADHLGQFWGVRPPGSIGPSRTSRRPLPGVRNVPNPAASTDLRPAVSRAGGRGPSEGNLRGVRYTAASA